MSTVKKDVKEKSHELAILKDPATSQSMIIYVYIDSKMPLNPTTTALDLSNSFSEIQCGETITMKRVSCNMFIF